MQNKELNVDKYIGLPYKVYGRDESGVDCYGLVYLIYRDVLGINIPSFETEGNDDQRTAELIAQYKEGWEATETPSAGDVIVFRIMGIESHVGVAISSTHFIHAKRGTNAVVEAFDNPRWKTRIVGSFKYAPKKHLIANGIPHPLRTEKVTIEIPSGLTAAELKEWITKEYKLQEEYNSVIHLFVNGFRVLPEKENTLIIKQDDTIEFRVIAQSGDGFLRTILNVAVVVAVAYATGGAGLGWGASVGSSLGIGAVAGSALVSTGLTMIGMSLVDAIAPVRMPSAGNISDPINPGSPESQLMVTGGANQVQAYGTIPFVLGKIRMTPPLGASSYSYFSSDGKESYLRMLLVWGYGPLQIDATTLKIGQTALSSYEQIQIQTIDYITEPTTDKLNSFNNLYGKDITQVQSGVEITCDGVAGNVPNSGTLSFPTTSTLTLPIGYVADTFSANIRYSVYVPDAGFSYETTQPVNFSIVGNLVTFTWSYSGTITYYYATSNTPGPWLDATSSDGAVGSFELAVHFPQGCRKVRSRGSDAGVSYPAPVVLEVQWKTVSSGTWSAAGTHTIGTTAAKDAFTWTQKFTVDVLENIQVRIRRLTGTGTGAPVDQEYQWLFTSTLIHTTFILNTVPAINPVGAKIAKTAFEVKASDQLNGQIEGINAVVQSYCLDWDNPTDTWVMRTTQNPASLFRLVLEHPANPRKVTDIANKINLTQLQYWHEYCTAKGFQFNSVVASSRSVLEVLRDICAAGRASPAMVDGKWTVTIDEEKTNVVQHFTPHNSWGFEGAKALPKLPDGLRVTFLNEDKDYQQDELIVYAAGKSKANASLLETISLPGVTKASLVKDHARWHMAQALLRPEVYTLNTDIEYIVCNRGDRVKVMHDVPMWGLGSGRIKDIIGSVYYLDESLPMDGGVNYTIRVRGKSGSTTVRTVVAKPSDGYYNQIELTASATTTEIDVGDLFLFGELNQESQDCLVISIEPTSNKSALIKLVDYGVTNSYNIFTDYLTYTENIAFESQISLPPKLLIQSFGTKVPTITGFISDERVMEKVAPGVFAYKMKVSYTNASALPSSTASVEFQYDYANAVDYLGTRSTQVAYNLGSVTITDVQEGDVMKVRARYVGDDGRTGQWTTWSNHTIVGKLNPPSDVSALTATVDGTTGKLKLSWAPNTEPDIKVYEVRTDTNWGSTTNLVFLGDATSCLAVPPVSAGTITYYIRAIDYSLNYSVTATSASYTTATIPNVTLATATFFDDSKTSAYVTLDWPNASPEFGLSGYKVSYDTVTTIVGSNTLMIRADWVGTRVFTIKTVDTNGNESSGYTLNVTKSLPNAPTNPVFSIDQATAILDWDDSIVSTLPVWGYEVRTNTAFGDNSYLFKGAASTCSLSAVNLVLGTNTFYIKAIDTDNNYSSTYLTADYTVSSPPNISDVTYVFADTSLTAATITLSWTDVSPQFELAGYEISYDSVVKVIKANSITLPANWVGERTYLIKTIDALGNKSSGFSKIITKNLPNPVTNFRSQVIDNTVMFYWDLPAVTSLPIDHVLLKKGATWATATTIGEKKGGFTTQNETTAGTYTYWIAAVDTDDNESTPVAITTAVAQPPDFVFFAQYDSTFTGTKSSAVKDVNVNNLILPVNTTETFQQHFTNNSWTTPQDQITAGYPIYAQPTNGSGYYEETFDYGTLLTSSKISVIYKGTIVAAPISISTDISTSTNGSTWTNYVGVSEVFATSFRYVKVRLTATASSATGLYNLESLLVKLDSKLLNDAGTVSCLSTDTLGTIVNFNKEFVDVTSITVTPQGTSAIIPVYDFRDSVDAATYAVVSNVCTVTLASHGFVTGQKVRIGISTGSGTSGVYTITGTATNTFTVAMTTANTSGNCSTYAESFRVYLFNTSGARVSATASWSLKGY